jgi:hypothetical protein
MPCESECGHPPERDQARIDAGRESGLVCGDRGRGGDLPNTGTRLTSSGSQGATRECKDTWLQPRNGDRLEVFNGNLYTVPETGLVDQVRRVATADEREERYHEQCPPADARFALSIHQVHGAEFTAVVPPLPPV